MSSRTLVTLVSDIDGAEADETIDFTWGGKPLTIDLTTKQADKFRAGVERYVNAARPVASNGTAPRGRVRRGGVNTAERLALVRAWAQSPEGRTKVAEAGLPEVADRGRIAARVYELYDARPR